MKINSIKTIEINKNLLNTTFKGIEQAYAYSLPVSNPSEYRLGLRLKLNDKNSKDLSEYKALMQKFNALDELALGKNYNPVSSGLNRISDDTLCLEVSRVKGPRSGYGYFAKINNKDLSTYVFEETNKAYATAECIRGNSLQNEFNKDLKKFIQNLSNCLFADSKFANTDLRKIAKSVFEGIKKQADFTLKNTKMI